MEQMALMQLRDDDQRRLQSLSFVSEVTDSVMMLYIVATKKK